jgi:hypothetical protein
LAVGRLLQGQLHHGFLDVLLDAVLHTWLAAADFLQRQLTAFFVKLFEAIETVSRVAHHLASLRHTA